MKLHRLYILYRLPSILMLDWTEVTKEESTEAKIRGQVLTSVTYLLPHLLTYSLTYLLAYT